MTPSLDQEHLRRALRRLDDADRATPPRPDVTRRALAAFDARQRARNTRPVGPGWWTRRGQQWAAGVAATVAVAAGVVLLGTRRPDAPIQASMQTQVSRPAAQREPPTPPLAERAESAAIHTVERRAARRSDSAVGVPVVGGRGDEFVALFPMREIEQSEAWQLMRVRLRGSTLRGFGVPLDVVRDDRTIQADVLVGEDGLARAIRFVRRDGEW